MSNEQMKVFTDLLKKWGDRKRILVTEVGKDWASVYMSELEIAIEAAKERE